MLELGVNENFVEWVPDHSVDAGELRTIGALSVPQFLRSAKVLFSHVKSGNIVTDGECSFHIHLSIPGISHSYSEKFQKSLIEGVMRNAHQLPDSILRRWQNVAQT
jgi:hypothetical protein